MGELFATFEKNRDQTVFSTTSATAPKAVRLGFHDCFKYEDGTGGCDGCLDWKDINFELTRKARGKAEFRIPKPEWMNPNRGLVGMVEYLELVYTRTLASTGTSLRGSGKTRADLWAFSAIVAIEFGTHTNN